MGVVEGWRGRCFEDFVVGDVYRHPLGRTISEADNTWFTLLTMNTHEAHFNADFAERTEFGRILVNSGLTVAIVLGQSVTDVSQQAIANLGWGDIELVHPVFVGDTLYAESLVVEARPSRSRPEAGIVTVRTRGLNQHGETCLRWRRSVLVRRRSAAEALRSFPVPAVPIENEPGRTSEGR
jgi:itaconyl-CoA hydratase